MRRRRAQKAFKGIDSTRRRRRRRRTVRMASRLDTSWKRCTLTRSNSSECGGRSGAAGGWRWWCWCAWPLVSASECGGQCARGTSAEASSHRVCRKPLRDQRHCTHAARAHTVMTCSLSLGSSYLISCTAAGGGQFLKGQSQAYERVHLAGKALLLDDRRRLQIPHVNLHTENETH